MIKRKYNASSWVWGTTTTTDFWRFYEFQFGNIPSVAEYQAVFDEYRINAVKFEFRPRYTSVSADTAGATGAPTATAHVIVDPASTVVPSGTYTQANLNFFLENSGVRTYQLNRPFSVYWKPKVLYATQSSGTAAAIRSPPFYRTTETVPPHRGFHMFVHQNNFSASANANIILDVFVTAYMTLRNLR